MMGMDRWGGWYRKLYDGDGLLGWTTEGTMLSALCVINISGV